MRLLVVVLAVCACSKKPSDGPVAPSTPATTSEQDALWSFAPDGAFAGGIVTPTALARLDAAYNVLASTPALATLKPRVDEALTNLFGISPASLAVLGWTSKPGLAVFFTNDGGVAVLPVVDRDKFLAAMKGTKGTTTDTINQAICKTVKGVYACARNPGLLDRLGKGSMVERLKLVGARGDIEVVGTLPFNVEIAGVAEVGRGSVTVRAAVKGAPKQVLQSFVNAKPRTEGDTAGFALVDLGGHMQRLKDRTPALPIAPGVTADALAQSLVGPLTITVAHGATAVDARIPLSNDAPAKALFGACDRVPRLAALGASVKDGACHVVLPPPGMALDGWVDGSTLRIGQKSTPSGGASAALSPVAKELASGAWVVSLYGRGTMIGQAQMMDAMRSMSLLNEMGLGVRVDGDVIRGLATFRTAWSNPDEVVEKLLQLRDAKAVADAYPKSAFASDYRAGTTSLMIPTLVMGMLFSVAIPAFLDDLKEGKLGEAQLQLAKMQKSLGAYAAAHAAFPTGTIGPTPAKSCCETRGQCNDPAAWQQPVWKALEFAIAEPHTYRYSYASPDGKKFIVTAEADLDCDGETSEWVMSGELDARGNAQIEITPPARAD